MHAINNKRCSPARRPTGGAERVLFQADIARRYGIDRITVYRWEASGRLPAPDVVIGRRRGRYESTLRAWEASTVESER